MKMKAKPLLLLVLAFSMSALVLIGSPASAVNVIRGFSKKPTFTPPAGCVPRDRTYGVLSLCNKPIERGRELVILIETAAGFFSAGSASRNSKLFVKDHVAEIRAHWKNQYGRNKVAFSSRATKFVPRNAPAGVTSCIEYSIKTKIQKTVNKRSVPAIWQVRGLTCAWGVKRRAASSLNVELFWLEVRDEYAPSLGQKPLGNFDTIARKVFGSARL